MVHSLPLVATVSATLVASHKSPQRITWRNLGLLFNVPSGALPRAQSIKMAVHCCQTMPFSLPAGLKLVSPVYLVVTSSEAKFLKPVQLALKHTVKVIAENTCSQLTFVINGKPSGHDAQTLSPIEGGQFKVNSSTGKISMDCLHQLAIAIAQHMPADDT